MSLAATFRESQNHSDWKSPPGSSLSAAQSTECWLQQEPLAMFHQPLCPASPELLQMHFALRPPILGENLSTESPSASQSMVRDGSPCPQHLLFESSGIYQVSTWSLMCCHQQNLGFALVLVLSNNKCPRPGLEPPGPVESVHSNSPGWKKVSFKNPSRDF